MELLHPRSSGAPDLAALYAHPSGLRLGMVSSVDGAVAVDGSSRPLSGPADRQVLGVLRRQADVVLVGAGTARDEGYRPVQVSAHDCAARLSRGQDPTPRIAVLSRGRGLPADSPLLEPGSGLLLLTSRAGADAAPDHVDSVVVGSVVEAVEVLQERGLARILCEGGPTLNGALLQAGLVDEICLTTSPHLVGGGGPRLVADAAQTDVALHLVHLLLADGFLLGRWRVDRSVPVGSAAGS